MFSHALPPPPLPPVFCLLFHLNNLLEVQMAFQRESLVETDEIEAENEV